VKVTGIQACNNGSVINGCGIYLGNNSVVKGCQAIENTSDGLYVRDGSTVVDSVFNSNGGNGVYLTAGCTIHDCTACKNAMVGIYAYSGCAVTHCVSRENSDGIALNDGGVVQSCVCSENGDDGILVSDNNQVLNNTCDYNGFVTSFGYGIDIAGSHNTIDGNSVTRNDWGVFDVSGGNLIIRNRASGNTNNYSSLSGSAYGPILTGTGEISSTFPWANFEF
jgi:parallel beta-helix repeat protein